MTQARRCTREFADEAVRPTLTGRQREVAQDLGGGLSTLVRWIGRSRDRRATGTHFSSLLDVVLAIIAYVQVADIGSIRCRKIMEGRSPSRTAKCLFCPGFLGCGWWVAVVASNNGILPDL